MAQTVIGIFDSASEAQDAVEALVNRGFSRDTIDLSANSATSDTSTTSQRTYDRDDDDSGGIGGFFRSLFGGDDDDDDRTRRYTEVGSRGSIVTVHARSEDEAERAADLLDEYGAVDVDERSEYYRSEATGTAGATQSQTLLNQVQDFTQESDRAIPVIEENLQVGKRVVETGGVRVRSRVVERPVEEHLRLREERVHVQRTPVNRPVSDADLAGFQEGEIELTEHAEVPVVSKEARVVEEVTLGKEVQERDETIRDTVRRTDVELEQLGTTETERYRTENQTSTGTTGRTTTSDDL